MTCRASLLLATLAGVLVTGCSGGSDKPTTLPPITPTPKPSATAAPVVVPSAARVHDAFGAAAFVRFYYAQLNRAWSLPDGQLLAPLSDPECGTCKSYVETAQELTKNGQRLEGNSVNVTAVEAPPEENGIVAVDLFFDQPARSIVSTTGAVIKVFPLQKAFHKTVYVEKVPQGWLVRAVKVAV